MKKKKPYVKTDKHARIERVLRLCETLPLPTFNDLLESTGASRATLRRDIKYIRENLDVPLNFDRDAVDSGYRIVADQIRSPLPGPWLSSAEMVALKTMQHLLESMDESEGGFLKSLMAPFDANLAAKLDKNHLSDKELKNRIRIQIAQKRRVNNRIFEDVTLATLRRNRLEISYFVRSRQKSDVREVSPQRLVYWRNNWYLDAYCHTRNSLRTFSLDAIKKVRVLEKTAKEAKGLEKDAQNAYGIFRGGEIQWAVLSFQGDTASWIKDEVWHEQQQMLCKSDGTVELSIPFSESAELIGDILRYGSDVEVLAPQSLRDSVIRALQEAVGRYKRKTG